MSRWLRWQFVVPRLLLCVMIAMGAQYAIGIAVRSVAARTASQLLGTQVEVADARVSVSDGHVLLGAISVADPRHAGKRWFTAEGCELKLAPAPLLTKQTIISKARIRGVRIDASPSECELETQARAGGPRWFDDHAVEAAEDRLARIGVRFRKKDINSLESVRLATALCSRWQGDIAALGTQASELARRTGELERVVATESTNHLRRDRSLDNVPDKATDLRREHESLADQIEKLSQRLDDERRSIVAARRQDEEFTRKRSHADAIDAELLNAYLLRDEAARQLDGLIGWVRYLRQTVHSAHLPATKRGEDVRFAGLRPQPKFLIRTLELQGETQLLSRPVQFRGQVANLATAPWLQDGPIQLRLSAKDSVPFEVRATIDRTRGQIRDELFVDCREIPWCNQVLGRTEQLRLKVSPSTGSLNVSVMVDGDKLSGDIQLVQRRARITPAFACEGGNVPFGDSLDQSLAQLDSLATRISLSGTIEKPTCELWSNLGPAVAEALESGLQHHAEAHSRELLAEARRQVDTRLADVERQLADHQKEFAVQMASLQQRIDAIARSQTRQGRMSVEQLGRRLPTTSILR